MAAATASSVDMRAIAFTCPHKGCKATIQTSNRKRGHHIRCPVCNKEVKVPVD